MARWDTNELVATVKRRGFIPAADSNFTVDDFLAGCSEEQGAVIAAILESAQGGFLHSYEDFTISSAASYPINSRALMMSLQHVELRKRDTTVVPLNPVERGNVNTSATGRPQGFYCENNGVVLYPAPDATTVGDTLRMVYARAPNKLVQPSAAGRITAFNTGTKVLTFADTIPHNFLTTQTFDLIRGRPGFDHLAIDQTLSATSVKTIVSITQMSTSISRASVIGHGYLAGDVVDLYSPLPEKDFPIGQKTITSVIDPNTFEYSEMVGSVLTSTTNTSYTFAGKTVTLASALPALLTVGDYIALSGESPVAQIPAELHLSLALRGVVSHLRAGGDLAKAKALEGEAMEKEKRALMLLVPRVAQGKKKLVNRSWF